MTEDIALEIRDRADRSGEELSPGLRDFIDYEIGRAKDGIVTFQPTFRKLGFHRWRDPRRRQSSIIE